MCSRWLKVYTRWFTSAITNKIPLLVVRYEDIKQDKVGQVEKMLEFLNFEYAHNDISDKIQEDFTLFRRGHYQDQFEHYTDKQKRLINYNILKAVKELNGYDVNNSFRLEEYVDESLL